MYENGTKIKKPVATSRWLCGRLNELRCVCMSDELNALTLILEFWSKLQKFGEQTWGCARPTIFARDFETKRWTIELADDTLNARLDVCDDASTANRIRVIFSMTLQVTS
jgi:hypothetical protein